MLLRALQDRHLIETERGRIAVGWLIVEDLAMVLTLVLLPALAELLNEGSTAAPANALGMPQIVTTLAITLGKVAAFVALMLVVGRRVIPWILHYVAHTGSRELFRLVGAGDSTGRRLRRRPALRRVFRAGRLLRRHGAGASRS